MKIAVSGSSGLVGSALLPLLTTAGHRVTRMVRASASPRPDALAWDPQAGTIDSAQLAGCDAVVHLAGENIASGRWTAARKQRIRDSRVQGTRVLCEALARLDRRPRVLVCASAIGFYGDRGDELCDEQSVAGAGFLADVCQAWEAATQPARDAGIRVVNLRFGVILTPAGGALRQMLLPFSLGLGGRVGSGQQYMSWIAVDDAIGVILHAIEHDTLAGPVNCVAPEPVRQQEFARTLGRVLRRPTLLPMPAVIAELAFGQMANELLLASTRVAPRRLEQSGYVFRYGALEPALRHVLGR